jgi:hypothetical protein
MKFSQKTIIEAWTRSGSKCECKKESHHHEGRCNKPLSFNNLEGYRNGIWQANCINPHGNDLASNCEILCLDCFVKMLYETKGKLQRNGNAHSEAEWNIMILV